MWRLARLYIAINCGSRMHSLFLLHDWVINYPRKHSFCAWRIYLYCIYQNILYLNWNFLLILNVFWVLFAVISHHSLGCLLLLCTLFWGSLWSFISSSAVMFECDSTPFRCWVEKVQQLLSLPVMLLNGLNLDEQIQLLLDLFVEFIGSHVLLSNSPFLYKWLTEDNALRCHFELTWLHIDIPLYKEWKMKATPSALL